ncbi:hypothetical protein BCV69DRAFT_300147 [Microstroma glucosiphilum]|uniref:WKF domain-containing protein n=1 Tax=Pseudomicrostroma glucosiphilum TaxID=1684307 RepID=A0A316U3G5_9BASI|nr:hypothetical protein BCV69DRAFT_300147 [Pseudomicrostroma glucosiphilum]PWN19842.1 hypothetical protein BCV69DRAFT_300147 [Pseudomicrostroma glucosiphilum]
MTTLAEPVAGPSSGSHAINASSHANNDLPKRKRARTRKRKSGAAAGPTDQDDEDEESHQTSIIGNETIPVNDHASTSASSLKGKGKETAPTSAKQPPMDSVKVAPASATSDVVTTSETASKRTDEADSDDDDEAGEGNAAGRKRKRTRKRSKKGGQADTATAAGSESNGAKAAQGAESAVAPSAAAQAPGEELSQQLAQTPDPAQDESISQGAKNALIYAYIFCTSRQVWKFQKAKEGWLLRHILDHPSPAATETAAPASAEPVARTDTVSGEPADEAAQEEQVDTSIPDAYIALVGHYLSTMQGKSKDRLREELQRAIAAAEALPTEAPEIEQPQELASAPASEPEVIANGDSKGVRFADMADESNEQSSAREDVEKAKRERLRWQAARARSVLNILGAQ